MQPGVNLVGFLEAESGLGEIARRLGGAIERAEVPLVAIPFRGTLGRQDHPLELPVGEATYDTNLICLNPDNLTAFAAEVGSSFFARRYSIGVWFWETSVPRPEERASGRFLDELWVASEYVRGAIEVDVTYPCTSCPCRFRWCRSGGRFAHARTSTSPTVSSFSTSARVRCS